MENPELQNEQACAGHSQKLNFERVFYETRAKKTLQVQNKHFPRDFRKNQHEARNRTPLHTKSRFDPPKCTDAR